MLAERIEEYDLKLKQKGVEEGREEERVEIAQKMLKSGIDKRFISEMTLIPLVSLETLGAK